jgi:hypothetical protein
MTTIYIYDPKAHDGLPELPPLPIGALVVGTFNLLEQAADLPQPRYLTISDTQNVCFQFPDDKASRKALNQWALRFGGTQTTRPHEGKDGPETLCRLAFDYYGVAVEAYAFIPAETATT